ncbi:hypothetical protein WJ07_09000 [Burkholderia vietnamiensis]|nr:hypothetical protein WJ07_09000 [Burkholderia vietnamiensis]
MAVAPPRSRQQHHTSGHLPHFEQAVRSGGLFDRQSRRPRSRQHHYAADRLPRFEQAVRVGSLF